MPEPKEGILLLPGDGPEEEVNDDEQDDELHTMKLSACADQIKAFKAGDAEALLEAQQSFYDLCSG